MSVYVLDKKKTRHYYYYYLLHYYRYKYYNTHYKEITIRTIYSISHLHFKRTLTILAFMHKLFVVVIFALLPGAAAPPHRVSPPRRRIW